MPIDVPPIAVTQGSDAGNETDFLPLLTTWSPSSPLEKLSVIPVRAACSEYWLKNWSEPDETASLPGLIGPTGGANVFQAGRACCAAIFVFEKDGMIGRRRQGK